MTKSRKLKCVYCTAAGFDADLWDLGHRRNLLPDAESKRVFANVRKYRCPDCGEPKNLPHPPPYVPSHKRQ